MAKRGDNAARKQEFMPDATEQRSDVVLAPEGLKAANDRITQEAIAEASDVAARAEELSRQGASAQQQQELGEIQQRAQAAEKNLLHQLDEVERQLAAAQKKKRAANSVMARAIGATVRDESDIRAQKIRHADDIVVDDEPQQQKRGFFGRLADRFSQGDVNRWNTAVDVMEAAEGEQQKREAFDKLDADSVEKRVKSLREQKAAVEKKLRATQGMLSMFKRGERWELVAESDETQKEYEAARAELVADNLQAALDEQLGDMDQRSATLNETQNAIMDKLNQTLIGDHVTVRRAITMALSAGAVGAAATGFGAGALGLVGMRRMLTGGLAAGSAYSGLAAMESRSLANTIKEKRETSGWREGLAEFFRNVSPEDMKEMSDQEIAKYLGQAQELAITRGIRPSSDALVNALLAESGRRTQEKLKKVEAEKVAEVLQGYLHDADVKAEEAIALVKQNDTKRKLAAAAGASLVASGALFKLGEAVADLVVPEAHAEQLVSGVEADGLRAGNEQVAGQGVMAEVSDEAAARLADQGVGLTPRAMKDTVTGERYEFPEGSKVEISFSRGAYLIRETLEDGQQVAYRGDSAQQLMENRASVLGNGAAGEEDVSVNQRQLDRFAQASQQAEGKGSVGQVTPEAAQQLAAEGFVLMDDGSAEGSTVTQALAQREAALQADEQSASVAARPRPEAQSAPVEEVDNADTDASPEVRKESPVELPVMDITQMKRLYPSQREDAQAIIARWRAAAEKGAVQSNGEKEWKEYTLPSSGKLIIIQNDRMYLIDDGQRIPIVPETASDVSVRTGGEPIGFVDAAEDATERRPSAEHIAEFQAQREELVTFVRENGRDLGDGKYLYRTPSGDQLLVHSGDKLAYASADRSIMFNDLKYAAAERIGGIDVLLEATGIAGLPETPETLDATLEEASQPELEPPSADQLEPVNEPPKAEPEEAAVEQETAEAQALWNEEVLRRASELDPLSDSKRANVEGYSALINAAAKKYDLPPELISAVMATESGGRNGLTSTAGAEGLMQFMPGTARDMGITDRMDPAQSIEGGARYLAQNRDLFSDPKYADSGYTPIELSVMAYNHGEGNVQKWLAKGGDFSTIHPETRGYLPRVVRYYEDFGGDGSGLQAAGDSRPRAPFTPSRPDGPIRTFTRGEGGPGDAAYEEVKPISGDVKAMAIEYRARPYNELVDAAFDSSTPEDQRTAAFMAIVHKEGSTVWYKDGEIYKNQNKPEGAESLRILAYPDRVEFKFRGQRLTSMDGLPELHMHVEPPTAEVEVEVPVDEKGEEIVPLEKQRFRDQREAIIDYVYANGSPLGTLSEFEMPNGDKLLADDEDGKLYWMRPGGRRVEINSADALSRMPGSEVLLKAADPNKEAIQAFVNGSAEVTPETPVNVGEVAGEAEEIVDSAVAGVKENVPEPVKETARRAAEKANEVTTNNRLGVDLDTLDDYATDIRNPWGEPNVSRERVALANVVEDLQAVEADVENGEYAEWGTEYGRFVDDVSDAVANELAIAQKQLDVFADAQDKDLVLAQNESLGRYQEALTRAKLLVSAAEHPNRIGAAERDLLRDYGIALPSEQSGSSALASAVHDREAPSERDVPKTGRKVGFFVGQALREVGRADNVLAGVTENENVIKGVLSNMADNKLDRARALDQYADQLADGDRTKALARMRAETLRDKADRLVDLRDDALRAQDMRAEEAIENSFKERRRGGYRYEQSYAEYQQFNETPELKEEAIDTVLADNYRSLVKRHANNFVGPTTGSTVGQGPRLEVWNGGEDVPSLEDQLADRPGPLESAASGIVERGKDATGELRQPDNVITAEDRAVAFVEREAVRIYAAINQIEIIDRRMAGTDDPAELAQLQLQKEAAERFIAGRVQAVDRRLGAVGTSVFRDSHSAGQLSPRARIWRALFEFNAEGPYRGDRYAFDLNNNDNMRSDDARDALDDLQDR